MGRKFGPRRAGEVGVRAPDDLGRETWWPGGFIHYEATGKPHFVIHKRKGGVRYKRWTGAHTEAAAYSHLERFEKNPAAYKPNGEGMVSVEPVFITKALVQSYLDYCDQPHDERPANTAEWRNKKHILLTWWATALVDERGKALDLRARPGVPGHVALKEHVLPVLNGDRERNIPRAKGKGHRIRALKHFYSWLRTVEHKIDAHEDPLFGTLKTPQSRGAQRTGKKKVTTRENVEAVLALLVRNSEKPDVGDLPARKRQGKRARPGLRVHVDALTVQAATGWHTTEVMRFAESGEAIPLPPAMKATRAEVGILVCPLHKNGREHRTRVQQRAFVAAKRLLAHRSFSRKWYDTAIRDACKELCIEPFTPANMRHTNSTYAVDQGVDPKAVSSFHNHSEETSRKFYSTHATAAKVPTIIDDPVEPANAPDVDVLQARIAELEAKLRVDVAGDPVEKLEALVAAMRRGRERSSTAS